MTDGQGTTKLVTSSSQSITSTQETEAFGRTIGTTGSTASPFGYHGAEGYRSDGDGPAGLEPYQKVGARYYDPTFGRFITRDTMLDQSPYAYCGGDPVNGSDPSGHFNIAHPGATVNCVGQGSYADGFTGDADAAAVAANEDSQSINYSLSGVIKGTVTTQGNKTTTTASGSVTSGATTATVTVTQVNSPFKSPINTATVSGTYQFSPQTSGSVSITTGSPGSAPIVIVSGQYSFGPSKSTPKKQ